MELSVPNMLLAAKQCEIQELKHLGVTAHLVGAVGHLVHALQNERGASSIFLASSGRRFLSTRQKLIDESRSLELRVRSSFEQQMATPAFGSARRFSLMAWVLLGLDSLPDLRERISHHRMSPEHAVAAFSRLIAGLVSVIFEAADAAFDPSISRALVALFNFIQGKEQAGQERALGALSFASGICDGQHQQRLLHLIDAQERCFKTFGDFADEETLRQWRALQDTTAVARLERLRRILGSARPGAALDVNLSDEWFECCTERLNQMWQLQTRLVEGLLNRSDLLIREAERDLQNSAVLLNNLMERPPECTRVVDRFFDPDAKIDAALNALPGGEIGSRLGHLMMELLQAQSDRLARMENELESTRRSLNERKVIERAKGVLMARRNLSEEAAYKLLRQTSMDQNRRMVDVAEATLSLPGFIAP